MKPDFKYAVNSWRICMSVLLLEPKFKNTHTVLSIEGCCTLEDDRADFTPDLPLVTIVGAQQVSRL